MAEISEAAFAERVKQLEQAAAADPQGYRLRVLGLAALGYGYLFGVVVLLLLTTLILIVVLKGASAKLVAPLGFVIFAILRALWVRIPPPEGTPLKPNEAPELFDLVRSTAGRLKAPPVHHILVVPELNAAVTQVPLLGFLGWYRNYLLIGLPLMQALSRDEWHWVLAHEMGHLSGRHGWFGSWIYRVRQTWGVLMHTLETRESVVGKFFFRGFLEWFAPTFNAYTFVLARAHEYEADAEAAELAGQETGRRALLRLVVADQVADGFWSSLQESVKLRPEPPGDAYQQLGLALLGGQTGASNSDPIAAAWRRQTDYADTHPGLADRLRGLGWSESAETPPPRPEPLSQPSAARVYFQAVETRLARQYDQQWAQQVQERWQKHHSTLAKARQRLEELDQRGEDSLSPDERWERIAACWELDELDRLVELCRWTLERDPQHAGANYYLGRALLQREDPAGVPHLEAAMRRDPDAIVPVCMLLFSFYARRNDQENAERFRKIGMEREILLQQVEAERSTMDPKAQLEAHGWNAEDVAALREQLSRIPEVREAYLARRVVRHMPEQPCYVLCLVPHTSWWRGFDQDKSAHFVHTVARQVSARCELKVFSLALALKPLRKQLQQIPGTRIQ